MRRQCRVTARVCQPQSKLLTTDLPCQVSNLTRNDIIPGLGARLRLSSHNSIHQGMPTGQACPLRSWKTTRAACTSSSFAARTYPLASLPPSPTAAAAATTKAASQAQAIAPTGQPWQQLQLWQRTLEEQEQGELTGAGQLGTEEASLGSSNSNSSSSNRRGHHLSHAQPLPLCCAAPALQRLWRPPRTSHLPPNWPAWRPCGCRLAKRRAPPRQSEPRQPWPRHMRLAATRTAPLLYPQR
mmetsp:Transcript_26486/g.71625  ORF Transcript_26486/g.71625 Transcript_26486/m.71625 type:complete len:241 (+) Transcript_26486:825-1547(+)